MLYRNAPPSVCASVGELSIKISHFDEEDAAGIFERDNFELKKSLGNRHFGNQAS